MWMRCIRDIMRLCSRLWIVVCFPGWHTRSPCNATGHTRKNYKTTYLRLAKALSLNNMYIEESSGLTVHYGDRRLGMNPDMLACMLAGNVKVLTASDAHVPQDVGRYVKEMNDIIKQGALWNGRDCFDA